MQIRPALLVLCLGGIFAACATDGDPSMEAPKVDPKPDIPRDPNAPRDLAKFFVRLDAKWNRAKGAGKRISMAEFLADRQPTTAVFQIREEFVTDVRPPGGGVRLLDVTLDAKGCTWHRAEAHLFGDNARPDASGTVAGSKRIVTACRSLRAAGWLTLPETIPERKDDLLSGSRFVVKIRLGDGVRFATFERTLPYGAELDPVYANAVETCRLVLARWR